MARPRLISDEQILAATREAVLAEGPSVSLDHVASTLGVSGPALLKRFGSRTALLLNALRPEARPAWISRLEDGVGPGDFEGQLHEVMRLISAYMDETIPLMTALRESGIAAEDVFPKERPPNTGISALQSWLAAARRKGLISAVETDTAAFTILGAVQTRAFFAHIMKQNFSNESNQRYLQEAAALFSRALKAPAAKKGSAVKVRAAPRKRLSRSR